MIKKIVLTALVMIAVNASAKGYQSGWKVYEKPQSGVTYGTVEANPYGAGGGQSYGEGGGKYASNPWKVAD